MNEKYEIPDKILKELLKDPLQKGLWQNLFIFNQIFTEGIHVIPVNNYLFQVCAKL
jgi:hypothetical protein